MAKKKTTKRKPKATKENGKPTDAKPTEVKVEYFRTNMRCELSPDDIVEKSSRIARQVSEKALRVEAVKSATAHLKAEIKQIDSEISRLAQELNDKACFKEVECRREYQYRVGKVVETRMDTGAQTYERAMSGAERQPELPLPKTNGSKAETKPVEDETKSDSSETSGSDWDDPPESEDDDDPASESAPGQQDEATAE